MHVNMQLFSDQNLVNWKADKGFSLITQNNPVVSPGDILLSINGVDLTQLTYNEAVSVLKAQTAQSQVVLRVIQTLSEDSEEDIENANKDEMDSLDDLRDDTLNWTPLWTRWLGLPRYKAALWSHHRSLKYQDNSGGYQQQPL